MHKSTKLTPNMRRAVYADWCRSRGSFRSLGRKYHVDKNVVRKVVVLGRLGDFTVHDSANRRYRTIEYGLRRLARTEGVLAARAESRRGAWIDKEAPGELVHFDTKALPRLAKDYRTPIAILPREHLFVAVDDASRWLMADVMPERTGNSAAAFLESCAVRLPFMVACHYSDNGSEFKGNSTHPVVALCAQLGIRQKFTRPRHPWTNGKAERVIRTLVEGWLRPNEFPSYEARRLALYRFVDWYNHERPHMSLAGKTPALKLMSLLKSGDNAC